MSSFSKVVFGVLAGAILLGGAVLGFADSAAAQPTITTLSDKSSFAGDFEIPVNKSQILKVDRAFKDILVGNPKIADVLPLTNRTLYILGKELGTTSLSIYGTDKSLLAIVDLVVTHNVDGLKAKVFELFPDEKVEVRTVNDAIVLSGAMSSGARLQSVVELAERFAPGKVTNMMTLTGSQQVMLAVRFAEVKRTAFKELGINLNVLVRSGATTFSLLSGLPVLGSIPGSGFLNGGTSLVGTAYKGDFTGLLDALEQKGVVKTLAEPNLIALSGDTASFLAGGEFPIPVAQNTSGGGSTITIEFKEFGVSLAFTPTVLSDGLISLDVAPEVSAIDNTTSVQLNGLLVPGLTTRRAHTTIELRDGQAFAIAGLLQSEFKDNIDQLPFAGDVPVLGALFRSSDYLRNETELVIIVTPYLVKPVKPKDLRLSTDSFVPPSDADLFLMGQPESPSTNPGASSHGPIVSQAGGGAGLDGNIGHIIK
ncbi:MAG: type II and III secretion system protein family protein [Alphaproteobacteria bacterium]|nr:type II and III secretion system protein family protein [Alphaproteobacteria bacterium]